MHEAILNSLGDVVLVTDTKGIIVDVNNSIMDCFQYSREEVIGRPFDMLMPQRFREDHADKFSGFTNKPSTRRMGEFRSGNLVAVDKRGLEFYVDISLSHYVDEEGARFLVAVIRDISELVELKNTLQSNVATLERKNKELEQFAYILSHDLKAPARAITSLIDIINEDHLEGLSGDVITCFDTIKKRNEKMSELIDGILAYARAGTVKQEPETIDLEEIVGEVVSSLAVPDSFEIHRDFDAISFKGQKTELFQVLSNLIDNAIKYHDRKEGRVSIRANETVDEVEIRIIDDGPGIPEAQQQVIFEMFGTANKTPRPDSTGIGLAIVKKIIEQGGGAVRVVSGGQKGSEFAFTLKKEIACRPSRSR